MDRDSHGFFFTSHLSIQCLHKLHGPDVRKTFLSHLRQQFNFNGITMFDDQGIERSQIIAPTLTQAIRESRISIIVLSTKYASSSWCLDELLEILKCKEDIEQIVMSVFYGVDPSYVPEQTGEFGIAFNETCARKTEEDRRKWSQALTYVGNIAGTTLPKLETPVSKKGSVFGVDRVLESQFSASMSSDAYRVPELVEFMNDKMTKKYEEMAELKSTVDYLQNIVSQHFSPPTNQ